MGHGTGAETPAGHHVPLSHLKENPWRQNDPAGHVICAVVLAGHTNPLAHWICTEVLLHTYPAAHADSLVVPAGQKLPVAHGVLEAGVEHT
jgi:hypothetical protein